MFKLQANFCASLKQKKKQAKIKFLNKYGAINAQCEFFDQLSRMKMLNIIRVYTTDK